MTQNFVTHYLRIACLAIFAAVLSGCTTEMAYLSVQAAAKQQCQRQPPSEQAACQARLNKDDYDTYTKQRSGE